VHLAELLHREAHQIDGRRSIAERHIDPRVLGSVIPERHLHHVAWQQSALTGHCFREERSIRVQERQERGLDGYLAEPAEAALAHTSLVHFELHHRDSIQPRLLPADEGGSICNQRCEYLGLSNSVERERMLHRLPAGHIMTPHMLVGSGSKFGMPSGA